MFFDRALWMIFLIERGLSTVQIGFVESFLHFSIFIFEIPTGIVADIFGKRISLILSRLLTALYALGMIYIGHFTLFSLLFILYGIGETFSSGADEASLYEALEESKLEKKFVKIKGYYGSLATAGMAIGMFIGGWLQLISWEALYLSLAGIQLLAITPLFFVKEIQEKSSEQINKSYSIIKNVIHLVNDAKSVFKKSEFVTLILGVVTFTASLNALYIFAPLWLKDLHFSESTISFVFAADAIVGIFVYASVHRFEEKININKLILFPPIIATVLLVSMPFVSKTTSIALYILINNMAIFFYPLSSALINKRVKSKSRATVLSTVSFMGSFVIMILFPSIGYLAQSIQIGFVVSGLALFSITSLLLLLIFNFQTKRKGAQIS